MILLLLSSWCECTYFRTIQSENAIESDKRHTKTRSVEANLVIIAASLPAVQQFFLLCFAHIKSKNCGVAIRRRMSEGFNRRSPETQTRVAIRGIRITSGESFKREESGTIHRT